MLFFLILSVLTVMFVAGKYLLQPRGASVAVEEGDIGDADVDSFFEAARNTDVDFRVRFVDRVVVVPRGGDSGEVAVAVVRK